MEPVSTGPGLQLLRDQMVLLVNSLCVVIQSAPEVITKSSVVIFKCVLES